MSNKTKTEYEPCKCRARLDNTRSSGLRYAIGCVESPVGLVRKLVNAVIAGTFVAEGAARVRAKREQRSKEQVERMQNAPSMPQNLPPRPLTAAEHAERDAKRAERSAMLRALFPKQFVNQFSQLHS